MSPDRDKRHGQAPRHPQRPQFLRNDTTHHALVVAEQEDAEGDEDTGEVAVVERNVSLDCWSSCGCCSSTTTTATHMSDFPVRGPRPPVGGMAKARARSRRSESRDE